MIFLNNILFNNFFFKHRMESARSAGFVIGKLLDQAGHTSIYWPPIIPTEFAKQCLYYFQNNIVINSLNLYSLCDGASPLTP